MKVGNISLVETVLNIAPEFRYFNFEIPYVSLAISLSRSRKQQDIEEMLLKIPGLSSTKWGMAYGFAKLFRWMPESRSPWDKKS